MIEKEFDDKIRNLVDSVEETVGGDMWFRIEADLIRKKRIIIIRRMSYVAVAASLVIGSFLIVPNPEDSPVIVLAEAENSIEIVEESKVILIEEKVIAQNIDNKISVQEDPKTFPREELYVKKESSIQESVQQPINESVIKEEKKEAPKRKAPKKEYKTISDQIDESSYLAAVVEVKKNKRYIALGFSSNTTAGSSLSENASSFPNFSSGQGSSPNYGIVPVSTINNSLPVTFGVQLRVGLGEKFGVGIGANYTFLHSKYEAIIDKSRQGVVSQSLHYIGVPISLYYNILHTNSMKFYVNGGGMVEKGLQLNYKILGLNASSTHREERVHELQWSVNVGIGFEYKIVELLGIYIDPSLTYFFEGDQPYSIRTNHPLQFRLEVGFRFHL